MDQSLEIAVFCLKPGVTTDQFLQAADANAADFQKLNGFVRRELACSENGQWLDVVSYESRQAAEAAEPILSAAPSIQAIMVMIDIPDGGWFHATPTRSYARRG